MANEIQADYNTTGSVLYSEVRDHIARIYNQNGLPAGVEAYQTANIADYALTMTEQGTASKHWVGDFPSGLPVGIYHVRVKVRAGGAPAESDSIVVAGPMHWSGSVLTYLGTPQTGDAYARLGTPAGASIAADIAAIQSDIDDLAADGVTVTSPVVASDEIEIVRGDDYYLADSRQLGFTFTGAPSITGATVYLKVKFGADVLSVTGTVTSSTACYFELTSTNTLQAPGPYLFDVSAVLSGSSHVVTLTRGTLKVLPDAR